MDGIYIFTCFFKRLDTLGMFSTIFEKGDKIYDFLFAFLCIKPVLKPKIYIHNFIDDVQKES